MDSGYANQTGYLAPFRGERYHLQDYKGGRQRQPRSVKELFNYRHSSLRNVIERCFGVLKNRFQVLRKMPAYPMRVQSDIIISCCGLHNFIKDEHQADIEFARLGNEEVGVEDALNPEGDDDVILLPNQEPATQRERSREMAFIRKGIANQLARYHGMQEIV